MSPREPDPRVCGLCRHGNQHVHDYGMYFQGPRGRLSCKCDDPGHPQVLGLSEAVTYIKKQLKMKTDDELARRLGVTRMTVSNWATRRVAKPLGEGRRELYRLALELNIKIRGMERG